MTDAKSNKPQNDTNILDPFERFGSEEERLEALERFRKWLEKLECWDCVERHTFPGPSPN